MAMPDALSFPFLMEEREKVIFAYKLQIIPFERNFTECTPMRMMLFITGLSYLPWFLGGQPGVRN
jgi:hypothetical protein